MNRKHFSLILFFFLVISIAWGQEWERATDNTIYPKNHDATNVCIGTTDPQGKRLNVNGNVNIEGNMKIKGGIDIRGYDPHYNIETNGGFITTQGSGGTGIKLMLRENEEVANAPLIVWDPTKHPDVTCMHSIHQWGNTLMFSSYNQTQKLNDPNPIRIMYLDGKDGNVGIGTADPKAALHILRKYHLPSPIQNIARVNLARFESKLSPAPPFSKPRCIMDIWSTQFEAKIGIGVCEPKNILEVMQDSKTDPVADAWTEYSSKRWKTNIHTIESAIEKVKKLRGVNFNWKSNGRHDIGLIGEEVGEVIPEVVIYEENSENAQSVSYSRLVALLIEAVKEQQLEIESQREIINKLLKN